MRRNRWFLLHAFRTATTPLLLCVVALIAASHAVAQPSWCVEGQDMGWQFYCTPVAAIHHSQKGQTASRTKPITFDDAQQASGNAQARDGISSDQLSEPTYIIDQLVKARKRRQQAKTQREMYSQLVELHPGLIPDRFDRAPIPPVFIGQKPDEIRKAVKSRFSIIFIGELACDVCLVYQRQLEQFALLSGISARYLTLDEVQNGSDIQLAAAVSFASLYPVLQPPVTLLMDRRYGHAHVISIEPVDVNRLERRVYVAAGQRMGS